MAAVIEEDSESGQLISASNRLRQYDFLADSFRVWQIGTAGFEVGHRFFCELNFYATQYLSEYPGQYRNIVQKNVVVGNHNPPPWQEVGEHMDRFVLQLGKMIKDASPMEASAYALWRLNWIHPFVQGNGRTARALSYFVLCQKMGHWFSGKTIPERIRATRDEYCELLRGADSAMDEYGMTNLGPLISYLNRLLVEQLS